MNKVDQMWYLLHICYDFTVVVNPFFRAVHIKFLSTVYTFTCKTFCKELHFTFEYAQSLGLRGTLVRLRSVSVLLEDLRGKPNVSENVMESDEPRVAF